MTTMTCILTQTLNPNIIIHVITRTSTSTSTSSTASTSSSTTTSATTHSAPPRPLDIADVKAMVEALVPEMFDSGLFVDHLETIRHWEMAMNQLYLMDLSTPEGRQKASIALCALLHKVIRPTSIAYRNNTPIAMQVGAFNKKCMEILRILCPDAAVLQKLVESYPSLAKKRLVQKEKIEKVIAAYALLEEQLDQMTQLNLNSLVAVFNELKAQLLVLNQQQITHAAAIEQQIKALTRRMAQMSAQLSTHASSAVVAETTLLAYKESLLKNVRDMRNLAKEVA